MHHLHFHKKLTWNQQKVCGCSGAGAPLNSKSKYYRSCSHSFSTPIFCLYSMYTVLLIPVSPISLPLSPLLKLSKVLTGFCCRSIASKTLIWPLNMCRHRYKSLDVTCHNDLPFQDGTIWQPSYLALVLNFKIHGERGLWCFYNPWIFLPIHQYRYCACLEWTTKNTLSDGLRGVYNN